jgi:hypothetical protein
MAYFLNPHVKFLLYEDKKVLCPLWIHSYHKNSFIISNLIPNKVDNMDNKKIWQC